LSAFPTWGFAANTHLLKLQRLQNKFLRTIDNFPRRTPVRELHKAFNIPYIYDYITKLAVPGHALPWPFPVTASL
jgi:hypothetical protein